MNAYSRVTGREVKDEPPPPKTEESKARVREKTAQFLAQANEFRRSKEKQTDEPMTAERAEMFRQIMALPDRGEPTFEVQQYRKRITTVMEDQQ